jgi:large subunit ribosomal protein L22
MSRKTRNGRQKVKKSKSTDRQKKVERQKRQKRQTSLTHIMESKAIARHVPTSPRKMRLVIDTIRGKSAAEALTILRFSPKSASKVAEMTLRSAISNLRNSGGSFAKEEDMIVKSVHVDQGKTLKRISPAPMGRAYKIKKRSHHLTIVVSTND